MAKSKAPPTPITSAVRQAIEGSGLTRYQLWKLTGIDQGALSRFANGRVGLNTETLDRLAPALGLRIVVDPPKKPARKKTP